MVEGIAELEKKIYENRELFNREISQILTPTSDINPVLPQELIDIIYRRFDIIEKKLDSMYKSRIDYFFHNQYDEILDIVPLMKNCFSPTIIIDTPLHMFTHEQLKLLNRGPSYVPPCQMYVSAATSNIALDTMIDQQYKVLQHSLANLFAQYNVNITRSMFLNKTIKDEYKKYFTIALPQELQQRACYEQKLLKTIREHLKTNHLILRRTADQRNIFYLGYRNDFENKVKDYIENNDIFEICEIIDNENLGKTYNYINQMIKTFNENIDFHFHIKKTHKDILNKIYANIDNIQLAYLYFLPDVSQVIDIIPTKKILFFSFCCSFY